MKLHYFLIVLFIFFYPQLNNAQKIFRGLILNAETDLPVAFASVGVLGMEIGSISDSSGAFKIFIPHNVKNNDTILFSSVGFSPLKLAVKEAMSEDMFLLKPVDDILPSVTIGFTRSGFQGGATLNYTRYRGWYEYRTGGEIGSIMKVLHKQYKLNRIVFQLDNKCDTCWLRLRIKKVIHLDEPAEDLLTKSLIIPVSQHTPLEGFLEIDLSDLDLVLKEKRIYVGFEVINCKNNDERPLSLCFIGTDYGDYYFRKYPTVKWENENRHGLFLRLFFDY